MDELGRKQTLKNIHMKRILVITIVFIGLGILPGIMKGQQKDFAIKVEMESLNEKDTLFLITYDDKKDWDSRFEIPLDTVLRQKITENKMANYAGKIAADGKLYAIRISGQNGAFMMLISGGENIVVNANIKKWPTVEVKGSRGTTDMQAYQRAFAPLMNKNKTLEASKFRKDFLAAQTNSLYTAFVILMSKELSIAERKAAYQQLTPYVQNSYFGLKIAKAIKKDALFEYLKVGNTVPNFKVNDSEGKAIWLYDLLSKSKYTLVDFWASWCRPCRTDIPNLKTAYATFHDKGFNILNVSIDKDELKWKKALKEENTPWVHAIDTEKICRNRFGVIGIPASILLNEKAEIVMIDMNSAFLAPSKIVGAMNGAPMLVRDKNALSLRGEELSTILTTLLK